MLYKTRYNSGHFYTVLSEDFCAHKIMSVELLADDQGTFCIVFAFSFTSSEVPNLFLKLSPFIKVTFAPPRFKKA